MGQNNYGQYSRNSISIDEKELLDFMKNSQPVSLPKTDIERRKMINRHFRDSCMLVQIAEETYLVGTLNWTSSTSCSMTVNGKERELPYSSLLGLFEPRLC
jgi:hypothetical protein